MEKRQVATMTKRGYVKTPTEKADFILAYVFETLPSENWLLQRNTKSVQSLIAEHTNDTDGFINALRQLIQEKFDIYFDHAVINVEYSSGSQHMTTGRASITVNVIITENGEPINVLRQFSGNNGVFSMVVKQVNYGD